MSTRPFSRTDSFTAFRSLLESTMEEIRRLEADYVLRASSIELEQYYVSKASINPLVLHVDRKYIESESRVTTRMSDYGRSVSVPGTEIRIAIPYDGDKALWDVQPSRYGSSYPDIDIGNDEIVLSHTIHDNDASGQERVKATIDRYVDSLASAVDSLARDIEQHNQRVAGEIPRAIASKRDQAKATSAAIASLGIPKKRAEPLTYAIPVTRKPSPVSRPAVPKGKYEPEPELPAEQFEFILRVLKSMALVMERDPGSFAELDEPSIRGNFLLQLNGHYEGSATGETFNAEGKTDILIRVRDRNVFIAECKFWRGPKSFEDAVDQLLGYLSWRDSKCALLIFNKTQDSSAVAHKMHEIMEARSEFRKTVMQPKDGEARYIFVKASDPGREIHICTMLFDVPAQS